MTPQLIGITGIAILLVLMFVGIPMGVSMALVGLAGYAAIAGFKAALYTAATVPYQNIASYMFSILPVFILMGIWAELSGITKDAYRSAYTWMGRLPGGMAMSTIGGAALFSAITGDSMSCSATMAKISTDDLLKYKYDPALATGALSAGGTLGQLIPPGTVYIFFAMLTNASVGAIMLGCIIPGFLLTIMFFAQIYIQCRINPKLGPAGPRTSMRQKLMAVKDVWGVLLLFSVIMFGIYFGIFTPTEAGAVGSIGAIIFAFARKGITVKNFIESLKSTIEITGAVFAIIIGAMIFTYFVSISGLPQMLADWLISFNFTQTTFLLSIIIVYFILGTAMDTIAMVLLTVPVFLPVVKALNIDLVLFCLVVIIQAELSQISPPVGANLFVVYSIVKEKGISIGTVFRGAWPYCFTLLLLTILIIFFPKIVLFLPHSMVALK